MKMAAMSNESKTPYIWRIYFWMFGAINLVLVFIVAVFGTVNGSVVLQLFLDLGSIIGMWAFAYRKRLFVRAFWKAWWVVAIGVEIVEVVNSNGNVGLGGVTFVVFIVPLYVALFLYAYRDRAVWKVDHEE